jgi:hypothetical protein
VSCVFAERWCICLEERDNCELAGCFKSLVDLFGIPAALLLIGDDRVLDRAKAKKADVEDSQINTILGAILVLFGLLLAFTISMASSRYETRRHLI